VLTYFYRHGFDLSQHKLEEIRTKGECCFNHIIGLPIKEGLEKPIFDYQKLLYEALLSPDLYFPIDIIIFCCRNSRD
jgi:hypothetical protein